MLTALAKIGNATGYSIKELLFEISYDWLQALSDVSLEINLADIITQSTAHNLTEETFNNLQLALRDEEDIAVEEPRKFDIRQIEGIPGVRVKNIKKAKNG